MVTQRSVKIYVKKLKPDYKTSTPSGKDFLEMIGLRGYSLTHSYHSLQKMPHPSGTPLNGGGIFFKLKLKTMAKVGGNTERSGC